MKRDRWQYNQQTEARYRSALERIGKLLARQVEHFKSIYEMMEALRNLSDQKWFRLMAYREAARMVNSVQRENATTWRKAAMQYGYGTRIHSVLKNDFLNQAEFQKLISDNSQLIRTLPAGMAEAASKKASTKALAGMRSEQLTQTIQAAMPDLAEWQARRIARTEVSKAQAAVTQLRSVNSGFQWYIWRTVKDARVRGSHDEMEGVVCRFSDPPAPELLIKAPRYEYYNPGGIYNCRCYAEPIVLASQVKFPVKVWQGGRVVRMNKREFEKLTGL